MVVGHQHPNKMTRLIWFMLVLVATWCLSTTTVAAWAPPSGLTAGFRRQGRLAKKKKTVIPLHVLAEQPAKTSSSSASSSQVPPSRAAEINQAAGAAARERKRQQQIRQQEQLTELPSLSNAGTPLSSDDASPNLVITTASNGEQQDSQPQQQNNRFRDINNMGVPDVRNLSIPQIHLPPRLAPGVAWEHHHKATTHFVKNHWPTTRGYVDDIINNNNKNNNNDDNKSPSVNAEEEMKKKLLVSRTSEWKRLQKHVDTIEQTHLRDLLQDEKRCDTMFVEHDGVYLDYSRQRATLQTMNLLQDLAKRQKLQERIQSMVQGEKINFTEERAVLHTALRAGRDETIMLDGQNVVEEVHEVLDQIKGFAEGVRSGTIRGYTGKRLRNIVSVGIGGSYLGPEFLHEVLKTEPEGITSALGYSLRFLANVDPVDVERTCADLDPEETLIVIVSKTFTTAETMLNARIMREWLWDFMGNHPDVVKKHVVACASVSATEKVKNFGIDTEHYFFRFWDWVGGRYSVCSAAGALPISLLYGFDLFEKFLKGAQSIDKHFTTAPLEKNIPVIMGLLGVWNMSFMGYRTRTTLPYAEALLRLPAHIQQLDMESNGKIMTKHGVEVDYPVGEIDFGEPGTNGQHSFFQLLHMGQTAPCDFIGFVQSQHDLCLDDESLSSHDELMANFFAQPDALANGKTADEVRAEGVREDLIPHKVFSGNRPSMSLLFPKLTAYATGQILAIYEHRTAVQGFLWDINSFDQWGVELGKKLAIDVKNHLDEARHAPEGANHRIQSSNPASSRILNYYVDNSREGQNCGQEATNTDTMTQVTTRKTPTDNVLPPLRHDLGGKGGRF